MNCYFCNSKVVEVLSFSKNKKEKYFKCKKCRAETKHQQIKAEDLDFKVLLKKMKGRSYEEWT